MLNLFQYLNIQKKMEAKTKKILTISLSGIIILAVAFAVWFFINQKARQKAQQEKQLQIIEKSNNEVPLEVIIENQKKAFEEMRKQNTEVIEDVPIEKIIENQKKAFSEMAPSEPVQDVPLEDIIKAQQETMKNLQ